MRVCFGWFDTGHLIADPHRYLDPCKKWLGVCSARLIMSLDLTPEERGIDEFYAIWKQKWSYGIS